MESNAAGATSDRVYEDFEPYGRWLREEKHDTLEINLKGFKKEQIKVQTNTKGFLIIFGERPLDASKNKWSRFHRDSRLPKDIIVNEISAKLSHGVLSVVMPKTVQTVEKEANEAMEKHSISGVKTRKRTAVMVAIGVVAVVVTLVALGTYVARVVNGHPHGGAGKVDVVIV